MQFITLKPKSFSNWKMRVCIGAIWWHRLEIPRNWPPAMAKISVPQILRCSQARFLFHFSKSLTSQLIYNNQHHQQCARNTKGTLHKFKFITNLSLNCVAFCRQNPQHHSVDQFITTSFFYHLIFILPCVSISKSALSKHLFETDNHKILILSYVEMMNM